MMDYKNKYLKYKNKYLNIKYGGNYNKLFCDNIIDNLDRDNIKSVKLVKGTILFHGNGDYNKILLNSDNTIKNKEIKYFNTLYNGSTSYTLKNKTSNYGYIGIYYILEDLLVYSHNGNYIYYDSINDYKNDIQCYCYNGYNGYCTTYNKNNTNYIDDIALCNYIDKIILIGYVKSTNFNNINNVDNLDVIKINENNNKIDIKHYEELQKLKTIKQYNLYNKDYINYIYNNIQDINITYN
jgi:hypothetical protein